MKIIIWGITLFLAGVISIALLLAGSMASNWALNTMPPLFAISLVIDFPPHFTLF